MISLKNNTFTRECLFSACGVGAILCAFRFASSSDDHPDFQIYIILYSFKSMTSPRRQDTGTATHPATLTDRQIGTMT
jgi:hypothetical protein